MISNEELYYRRSYRLLNKLIETYRTGFNKEKTYTMWKEEFESALNNYSLVKTARDSLMLTISIALMGLNKEKLEDAKKIENYDNDLVLLDVKEFKVNPDARKKLDEFESLKTKSSIFDKWLSLITSPETDKTSVDILKRVRNGLLHSNFKIDTTNQLFTFTNIKTKSYYESSILNDNFNQFILAYFSNHAEIGLPEQTITYIVNSAIKITDEASLREYLKRIIILNYKHKNPTYNGHNTLDYIMHVTANKNILNINKVAEQLDKNNITIEDIIPTVLNEAGINSIIEQLTNKNPYLYSLESDDIKSLAVTHLDYRLTPIKEISNILIHFFYVLMYLVNNNFDVNTEFFQGDEYAKDAYKPALMILKSYLILYRLQNNNFDELDYDKIDFDFDGVDYFSSSKNLQDPTLKVDYIEESYNKIKDKEPELDDYQIIKRIYIEIIRNSLAHGNIFPKFDSLGIPVIEFRDVFKDKVRSLTMDVDKLETLLASSAFEPKYCYKKEEEKTLTK